METSNCSFCDNMNVFICYCGKPVCEFCFGFSLNKHQTKTKCCDELSCKDIKYFKCERCLKECCSRCILKINEQIYCKFCVAHIKNLNIFKYCDLCNTWFKFETGKQCNTCDINYCIECSRKHLFNCVNCNENICFKREHYNYSNYVEKCGYCQKKYCKKCYKEPQRDFLNCVMCGIEYCSECVDKMKYCLSCENYHCLKCIGTEFKECQSKNCDNVIPKNCFVEDVNGGYKIDYNIVKHECNNCYKEFNVCNYCRSMHQTKINNQIKYLCSDCY